MSNRFLIICNAYPKDFDEYYIKLSDCDTTSSSVIYSNSIINGMKLNGFYYDAISAASVGHYPFTSKTKKLVDQDYDDHFFGVGYRNFVVTSQFDKAKSIFKKFRTLNYSKEDAINIVVTDVHTPFLKAALKIKKHYKNSRIVLICLDLPQFVYSSSKNVVLKLMKKVSVKQVTRLSHKVDGYVFLSEYMSEQFGDNNKPRIVIPAILDTTIYDSSVRTKKDFISFVYCGVLSKQYNIDYLLDSFSLLKNSKYKLVLAGKGDMVDEIKAYSIKDPRIVYLGELPREEAYKLQYNADVLVNPRLPTSEYTKLSFPSKTVSYLFSGNPLVCFALPSFPNKIKEVVISPSDVTKESFARAMEKALSRHNKKQIDVAETYSEKRVVNAIDKLFSEIRTNGK